MQKRKVIKIQLITKKKKYLNFTRKDIAHFKIEEKILSKFKKGGMNIHRISIAELILYKGKSEHANFLSLPTDVEWIYIHYEREKERNVEKIYIPWGENDGEDATESSLQKINDDNPRNISWISIL
jgi:hypothetical protein